MLKKLYGVLVVILVLIGIFSQPVSAAYTHEVTSEYIKIQAENYNDGGQNVAYWDQESENLGGAYRNDGVDIESFSEGHSIGYSRLNEWQEYTFQVQTSGTYQFVGRTSTNVTTGRLKVTIDGSDKGTLTVPNTGSFDSFRDVTLNNTFSLSQGQHKIRLTNVGEKFDTDWLRLNRITTAGTTTTPSPQPTAPTSTPTSGGGTVPAGAIRIKTTDNAASILKNNSAGKTFYFDAGVHRISETLRPDKGDKLIGQKGAIISGAKQLNSFSKEGALWVASSQNQEFAARPSSIYVSAGTSGTGSICGSGFTRCNRSEQLFINDKVLKHVDAKSKVVSGTWFFDYGANKMYFADNPDGKKVEASEDQYAIHQWDSAQNQITVSNLIVEKFATPAQQCAVALMSDSNIVEYNELRRNHGAAVCVGSYGFIRNNKIHNQGQIGIGGGKKDVKYLTIEKNEIYENNQEGFEFTWEAGGGKIAHSENLTFKNNYTHDNKGNGFWTDIDNIYTTYDGNIVIDNEKNGLQHEISYDATISNNFVMNNGSGTNAWFAQIYLNNSQNVQVSNNTVITPTTMGGGIIMQNTNRGNSGKFPVGTCDTSRRSSTCTPWVGKNVKVTNNKMYHRNTASRVAGLVASLTVAAPYDFNTAKQGTKFSQNKYYLASFDTAKRWAWGDWGAPKTWSEFKAAGQDTDGTAQSLGSLPSVPAWTTATGPR